MNLQHPHNKPGMAARAGNPNTEIDRRRKLAGEAALPKWGASHCVRDPVKPIVGKPEVATWCLVCPLRVDIQMGTAAFAHACTTQREGGGAGRMIASLFS